MKKMNNKGYAITLIVFGILIVFIIIMGVLLLTMNNSVKLNKTVKESAVENIQLGADTSGISFVDRIEQLESNYNTLADKLSNVEGNIIDTIYPKGSIYISTIDATVGAVEDRFPNTKWEKYAQGRTIIGEGTTTDDSGNVVMYTINSTGGNQNVSNININHTHSYAHTHSVPAHQHTLSNNGYAKVTFGVADKNVILERITVPEWTVNGMVYGSSFSNGTGKVQYGAGLGGKTDNSSSLTTSSQSTSITGTMSSNNIINAKDPYIVTYMYKRIN